MNDTQSSQTPGTVRKIPEKKPKVKLVGRDGNAFSVIAACKQAADKARWPVEKWSKVRTEMMGGDYDHLLGTAMKYFDVH